LSTYPNFEWYYFDLHSPDGHDIICTIHPIPFNSVFPIAIFDIYIYKDNKVLLHHFFILPAEKKNVQQEPFYLEYDKNNFIKKNGDEIIVKVKDEKIELNLLFTDSLKIKNPPKNELLDDPKIAATFDWIVYAPLCEGVGRVTWEDNDIELNGRGYHDYNCGSGNLKKALKYWYWGKYFIDDELFIYGKIISKNDIKTTIALDVTSAGLIIDNNPELEKGESGTIYRSNQKIFSFKMNEPHKIDTIDFYMTKLPRQLKFFVKVFEVVFHISGKFRPFSLLNKLMANSRYVRYRAEGKMDDGRKVTCFYEEMFL
jgi:hypothetical protein